MMDDFKPIDEKSLEEQINEAIILLISNGYFVCKQSDISKEEAAKNAK